MLVDLCYNIHAYTVYPVIPLVVIHEVLKIMSLLSDAVRYTRLAWGLREFFHHTLTLEECQQQIIQRLRSREKNFLNLVRKGIFGYPASPYLKLLGICGVEYGDIESLALKDGLETTLQKLMNAGVHLEWEEFKGRKDIVRGSSRFRIEEKEFSNPFLPVYYKTQSSGSRSSGTRSTFDFHHQMNIAYYRLPVLVMYGAFNYPMGIWKPVLPASSGIVVLLQDWKAGHPVSKWFSPVDERQVHTPMQHRLALRYFIYGSRLWGAQLPWPEYTGIDEAPKVARWMADTIKKTGGCSIDCYTSMGARISRAAIENGLDIRNARIIVSGEPLTEAKRRQIEASGAVLVNRYSMSGIGQIGYSCPCSGRADSVHFFLDSFGLVQRRRKVETTGLEVDSFLLTSLMPASPWILLNVESDDYGILEKRECDCLFGQLGLHMHIRDIRSISKLTGIGMTILGTDFVHILEEVLPSRFGGGATDYQLLEEEDSGGQTRLSLIISPVVGDVDEDAVKKTVISELRRSPHPGNLAAGIWSQGDTVRIKRIYPLSRVGKILTLHLAKNSRIEG